MLIVDAHQDIAWNTACYGRDYRTSAILHRQNEINQRWDKAMLGLPDALLGRVALTFSTLFAAPETSKFNLSTPYPSPSYKDAKTAYAAASTQLDYYHRLADETDRISLIRSAHDLDDVLASWDKPIGERKQGLVILMEGADPILEPKQFEEWYERGVRIVGTSWQATRYAGGTGEPGGLSKLGYELLEILASFNAILDVSHMAEQAFYEATERYEGILIASHSNPRRFKDSDRHLSDEMIRRLADRDGVMGVVLYNAFLSNTWTRTDRPLPITIVADVIDHICQVTGSAKHVGIGSDFDGGFGADQTPEGFETVGDLILIARVLLERGYDQADIDGIMGGNFIRKLRQALPT
ncbi:MAG: membrane dipeptidase [Phototrophicaceae bacterium]